MCRYTKRKVGSASRRGNEAGNGRVMIETRRKNHGAKRDHLQRIPNDGRKQFL